MELLTTISQTWGNANITMKLACQEAQWKEWKQWIPGNATESLDQTSLMTIHALVFLDA